MMVTRANIIDGLFSQNEQAEFEDHKGFWIQPDMIFIEALNPASAILKYREEFSKNKIGCSHNYGCSAIVSKFFFNELTDKQWKSAREKILL